MLLRLASQQRVDSSAAKLGARETKARNTIQPDKKEPNESFSLATEFFQNFSSRFGLGLYRARNGTKNKQIKTGPRRIQSPNHHKKKVDIDYLKRPYMCALSPPHRPPARVLGIQIWTIMCLNIRNVCILIFSPNGDYISGQRGIEKFLENYK